MPEVIANTLTKSTVFSRISTNGINADPDTILCDGQFRTNGASAFSTREST
jgi:hypothetical protein